MKTIGLNDLLTPDELREWLRFQVKGFEPLGASQNGVARLMGVTPGHLSRVLRGETEPGPKVLSWFGLEAVMRYRVYRSTSRAKVRHAQVRVSEERK